MSELPALDPSIQDDAAPFWDAAAEHRLVVPRCRSCETVIWYPRGYCPACSSFDIDWIELAGTGSIYSFSIPRRGQGAYRESAPYVVAYVELDIPGDRPGPRIITNIVDCDPDTVTVDMRVTAVFDDTPSGHALVRFRPV
ncbi:Zn-ribbon domain-containing OB-fold protein [Actinospongicola halichondriae]|uniref:Zn-ribbon domain-containing OB-fold protein n=1 Tax=Actinospongicola halichondriae TaxID=3236844 RepID=UPI003D3A5F34